MIHTTILVYRLAISSFLIQILVAGTKILNRYKQLYFDKSGNQSPASQNEITKRVT